MERINYGNIKSILMKLPQLILAFFILSVGMELMIKADLGLNPWGTFTLGLVNITGIQFGTLTQLIGIALLGGMVLLKVYPGIATLLDMFFIGIFINKIDSLGIIHTPANFLGRLEMCLIGLIIFCYGIYIYYRCGLGTGPRDSIVIGIMRRTGKGIHIVKPLFEGTVFIIGVIIGGKYGIGTIIITLFTGKLLDIVFKLHNFDIINFTQMDLKKTVSYIID
ncbi:MAG: YczE/YyaS/YitT family protein [Bacillota bacterium]